MYKAILLLTLVFSQPIPSNGLGPSVEAYGCSAAIIQRAVLQNVDNQAFHGTALPICLADSLPPQKENWANPADSEIRFDDEVLVFGEVEEGDEILAEYRFGNIGTDTLEIELVSTCDCIRADWPRGEILPGDSALITAIFDTKGRTGQNEKSLDVIFKNTDYNGYPLVKQLWLIGKIVPK